MSHSTTTPQTQQASRPPAASRNGEPAAYLRSQPADPPTYLPCNFEAEPAAIRKLSHLVASLAITEDGKLDKQPLNPDTLTAAATDDSDTWGDYASARRAVESGRARAAGPVLKRNGKIVIDMDKCTDVDGSNISAGAQGVIGMFSGCLVTRSVSGTGLHLWLKAKPPAGMTGAAATFFHLGQKVEILVDKFVAETWQPYGDAPGTIKAMQPQLDAFYKQLKDAEPKPDLPPAPRPSQNGTVTQGGHAAWARGVLESELAEFRATTIDRNNKLNDTAHTLARKLIVHGLAQRADIESMLMHEGTGIGLTHRECVATIRSGINAGLRDPYTLPPPSQVSTRVVLTSSSHAASNGTAAKQEAEKAMPLPIGLPLDDIGNGQRFAAQHGHWARYCHTWNKWLVWDRNHWIVDVKGMAEALAKTTARRIVTEAQQAQDEAESQALLKHAVSTFKRTKREAMLKDASSEPGIPITPDELDTDLWALNCANGTIDLRTGELKPHRPEDLLTKLAPVEYHPAATCPEWERFLLSVMAGTQEDVDHLQRAIGYGLTGDTREQCIFMFHGLGSNGKSTLFNILRLILGDYYKQAKEEVLMAKRYDGQNNDEIADLHGARIVAASETGDGKRLAEERVKQLSGGDPVTVCRKYEHQFTFTPAFKVFLATNHKPDIRGTDHAIWRRIQLIPFNVTFWRASRGETGPAECQADEQLAEKLAAELPGIFAWCICGCMKWQREGLPLPASVKAATSSYREEQDVLGLFLSDCCATGTDLRVGSKEIGAAYATWCETNGERPLSAIALGKRLKERGFTSDRGTKGKRFWEGICLKSEEGEEVTHLPEVTHCDANIGEVSKNTFTYGLSGKMRHNASPTPNTSPSEVTI